MFGKWRRVTSSEVRARLGEVVVLDDSALFFGIESGGATQLRGNGCLGASGTEVVFVRWWPRKEVRIERERITAIERTRSHLGKRIGRDLLKVIFTNDQGQADSIAWFVNDLSAWEAALATTRRGA